MARLNWETSIYKDQGFQDLMIAVQSRLLAKGIVLELFELAQEYWFPNRKPIPVERFKSSGLPECLFAPGGLCERRHDGIYCRGSKQAFAWLFEKASGGIARASTAERDETGRFKPKSETQQTSSTPPADTSGAGPADTSSSQQTWSSDQQQPGSLLSSLSSKKNNIYYFSDPLWPQFEQVVQSYPIKVSKTKAGFRRFKEHVKDEADFAKVMFHLANYKAYLAKSKWRDPKQSIESWFGTKQSGYFWLQWDSPDIGDSQQGSMLDVAGSHGHESWGRDDE